MGTSVLTNFKHSPVLIPYTAIFFIRDELSSQHCKAQPGPKPILGFLRSPDIEDLDAPIKEEP